MLHAQLYFLFVFEARHLIFLLFGVNIVLVLVLVLMYGGETWAMSKGEQNLLERTEMRMFRWIMGIKRIGNTRN